MGRKLCFIILGLILMSGIVLFFFGRKGYIEVLKINWGIDLPSSSEKIYYKEHNVSLGDGEYYMIFQYEKNQKEEILKMLEVEETYWINFNDEYLYYFSEKEDHSKLYIIWNQKDMLVYILEYIM